MWEQGLGARAARTPYTLLESSQSLQHFLAMSEGEEEGKKMEMRERRK
jgi:hypothetical protein